MTDEQGMIFDVHLPMRIEGAESPEEAIEAFIDQVASYGLRTWTYVVTSPDPDVEQVSVRPWEDPHAEPPAEPERPTTEGEAKNDRVEGGGGGETEGGQETGAPAREGEV